MKSAVIVFPGSNCDRDMVVAIEKTTGTRPATLWHKEHDLPSGLDLIAIPGGFSFGDYLRCGAIAARSPIMQAVQDFAHKGGHVLGVCNGFQVLCETGLLPGALMRNSGLKFICRNQTLKLATTQSAFTRNFQPQQSVIMPIAHHDGNYKADRDILATLQDQDRIAFTYDGNPNGSDRDIAGILSENRRVLGMMPHPERHISPELGGSDGQILLASLLDTNLAA